MAKQLKEAEREGYQRRDLGTYFGVFTRDASWTFGRRAVPDEHDYTLTNATHRTQLAGRWRQGPSGKERVFFRTLEVELAGDTGTAEGELSRHFFGGSERLGRIYRLKKTKRGWAVTGVRTWTLRTDFGPDSRVFNDEYLLDADERASKAKADDGMPFVARISDLVAAGWLTTAHRVAEEEGKRSPKNREVLRARTELGFTLGHFRDARRAAKVLRRLDPTAQLAPGL